MPGRRSERGAPRTLGAIERWFLDAIARPSALPARRAAARKAPPEAVILPSPTLSPEERLRIYADSYFARLYDCLAADYPAVRHLLGEEEFERLARRYLTRYPPRSYTLDHLGLSLPRFLREARDRDVPRRALVLDVARLERAMTEAFDARATPAASLDDLRRVPARHWPRARFRFARPFRLLSFRHRANAIVTAVLSEEKGALDLAPARTYVAVYRKEFRVWRMGLTRPMFAALRALKARRTLGEAIDAARAVWEGPPAALEREVFRWFREWTAEGFFRAVDGPAPRLSPCAPRPLAVE
jgi:hypothetical protein